MKQRAVLARYRSPSAPRLCIENRGDSWIYSLPDPHGGTFVGLVTRSDEDLDAALAASRLLTDLDRSSPHARWSCAASVRSYDRVTGTDWIAVGNAAFAPDPLSGGGVWFALHSADAAAAVLLGGSSATAYQAEIEMQVHTHVESRRALVAG